MIAQQQAEAGADLSRQNLLETQEALEQAQVKRGFARRSALKP